MADKPKKDRRHAKYSTWVCIKWALSKVWQWDKRLMLIAMAMIPVGVGLYVLNLYSTSWILQSLETIEPFGVIALTVVVVMVAEMLFRILKRLLDDADWLFSDVNSNRLWCELLERQYRRDFHLALDPEYRRLRDGADALLGDRGYDSPGSYLTKFATAAVNVICFIFFGSVIATLHPAIIALLVGGSLIIFFLQRRENQKNFEIRDEQNAADRRTNYLTWYVSNDPAVGKDVRLYNMADYLDKKTAITLRDIIRLIKVRQHNANVCYAVIFTIAALRDGIAYWYLIQGALGGTIDASMFVLYFTAITQMASFISDIINYLAGVSKQKLSLSDAIEYMEEDHNVFNHGKGIPLPRKKALSIEFKNVTYRYPEGDKNVLENVSFKIEAGEKISLVGLNGAGKTTLTQLMCGLLVPTEGEVLVDGHSVFEYNIDEFYTLFSLLPQAYAKYPTSVAENIAMKERSLIDDQRLWECLELAGIADKIRSLPKGVESSVDREGDREAIEFSGGEWQRLLLARVLYRDAPVMILDEPTAALDPIAENQMYERYNEITDGATAIFISHRLASARFCDRVYLLDGATFAECGTHDELIAKGGKYKELFDIQSRYYREGGEEDGEE